MPFFGLKQQESCLTTCVVLHLCSEKSKPSLQDQQRPGSHQPLSSFPTTYNPHVTHSSTDFSTYFSRLGPELTISLPNFQDSRNRKPIPEAFAEAVRHA